ncbi:stress-activated map kinase-interacting protein 1 [Culex quinquefasciatus]|uniref:stress-activated map kinase-interacting protein 1 n=1 Tax=Culex quinquefasciatus TaxID=7176 RepID=UPI0018E2B055|nr:stress-activated map kinase-interacting protein 1 [Culex quinquefasciatus]XP_038111534.1 stress-activated map kinase-interacting protein 1 [Culex quinquefasciatus]
MATYNNPHWLLSHIRNSFISTDDTGLSETVMLLEDLPHQYAKLHKQAVRERELGGDDGQQMGSGKSFESFYCYPGLDESDEEEMDSLSQSYEIQMDQDIGFHRQRSNTAQKLERLEIARRKASKVKNIKYESAVQRSEGGEDDELFVRKDVREGEDRTSMLSKQLETFPTVPQNKFLEYAKYDGTSQTEVPTKMFKIFLMLLPEEHQQRSYPMPVCVTAKANIQDFIGLICYKCSLAHPDVSLKSVKHYGLFMSEEDGEIDLDFPALDVREPCSKFCFTHLALAERRPSDQRTRSMTSDLGEVSTPIALSPEETPPSEPRGMTDQQREDLVKMIGHTSKLEAPLYRSFQVLIVHKARLKTEVQLGISGDKLEIDPIQQKSAKFWPRQKAANHSMDSVVHCSITERKSSKATIRIVYSAAPFSQSLSVAGSELVTQSPTIRQQQQQQTPQSLFKHYDIETDPVAAQEIVEKINNILEVRSSPVRREYIASRAQR